MFQLNSRIHSVDSLCTETCKVFIKRDDELSFGISGTKVRKFSSMVPAYLSKGIKHAIVIGSSSSNNVLGLVQILKEKRIQPVLFLLKSHHQRNEGNELWLKILASDCIRFECDRTQWPTVTQYAEQYALQHSDGCVVIPEGSKCVEAWKGSATLMQEITDESVVFDHIFLDMGTGFTALANLAWHKQCEAKSNIHVVDMSGKKEETWQSILTWSIESGLIKNPIFPSSLLEPLTGKSFGSVNHGVFKYIEKFAKNEGIFLDPLYSAKLFMTAESMIKKDKLTGNILIVHSGGGLSLSGFQKQFAKLL